MARFTGLTLRDRWGGWTRRPATSDSAAVEGEADGCVSEVVDETEGHQGPAAELSAACVRLTCMSDEVQLRDVEEADLEVFFEQEHDPEAVRMSKFPPRDREKFMTHWATKILGDSTVFVQTVTVGGEPAGSIVAWWEQDKRFIGYWFGRRYWGRGIGTNALTLFLPRETRPLYADPYSGNTGSVRLLERCGFQRAGTVRYGEHEHIMLVLHDED